MPVKGDGGFGDLLKFGRKRRKITRTERLNNAKSRAVVKLGDEEAADVVAVFRAASDAGDKKRADGIIITLLAQSLSHSFPLLPVIIFSFFCIILHGNRFIILVQ